MRVCWSPPSSSSPRRVPATLERVVYGDALLFTDPNLGADTRLAAFVDPYTGRVLDAEPVWLGYLPLSTWLDGLHRHLHLGEPGRVYSELGASWLWVVALGGVYLWVVKSRTERSLSSAVKVTPAQSISMRWWQPPGQSV